MKSSHSLVVLGLLALVSGLGALNAVNQRAEVATQEPVVTVQEMHPDDVVPGVDGGITRVLTSLGMMERRPLSDVGDIPDEVVSTLAAFNLPLVLPASPPGGSP
jgi:hypothetical protein